MLRVVLNISKSAHVTNENLLYAGIFRVSNKIAARTMRLVGHRQRHQELPASKLVLWEPTHGRPTLTYVDVLKKDAEAQSTDELAGRVLNFCPNPAQPDIFGLGRAQMYTN